MSALLALLSSLCWGTSDFIAGLLSRRIPAVAVVAWSQGWALLGLTLVLGFRGDFGTNLLLPSAMGAGISGSAALVCFYLALSTGTMGVVAPVASLGVVVPVLVGIARGDQAPPWAWFGVAVAVLGIVLASGPELSGGASVRPVLLAIVAGIGFGITLVLIDLGARQSVMHTLWGMRATSVSLFLVAGLILRSAGGVRAGQQPTLAVVGIVDLLANGLYAVASSSSLVSLASVLGSLYPVVTVVLARFVLSERLRQIQLVGVALSAVGAGFIAL
ncbi:MAG: EamA family transporter [Nostocoides sp.]